MIRFDRQAHTQIGSVERVLLCSGLGCGGLELLVGTQTDTLSCEAGRGSFDTSRELRQRRTTAGAECVERLEVLAVGLGPIGPVLVLGPCTLVTVSEEEERG